jgi:hypothetical protein
MVKFADVVTTYEIPLSLGQGSANFPLSRAAFAVRVFVEGRRKQLMSLAKAKLHFFNLEYNRYCTW